MTFFILAHVIMVYAHCNQLDLRLVSRPTSQSSCGAYDGLFRNLDVLLAYSLDSSDPTGIEILFNSYPLRVDSQTED